MSERALPDRRKTSRQRVMIGGCKLYIDWQRSAWPSNKGRHIQVWRYIGP